MMGLRAAMETAGGAPASGVWGSFQSCPASMRELIRVCTLPPPDLDDLEPDPPQFFHTFEEEDPQGIAFAHGERWFLSSQFRVSRYRIGGLDPFRPSSVAREMDVGLGELLDQAGLSRADYDHIGDLAFANGLVFLPVSRQRRDRPHLIMGVSENLELVAWSELAMSADDSLCAIHPWNGLLYVMSAERSDELEAYDVSTFYAVRTNPAAWRGQVPMPRRDAGLFRLQTPSSAPDRQGGQGVAFSPNGRIYVTRSHGDGPWDNRI